MKNLPARRLQFGVAAVDNKLIVVGGRDGLKVFIPELLDRDNGFFYIPTFFFLKTLNTVESFDLQNLTWQPLPPMNTHRHGLGVALVGGPLYATGGHGMNSFTFYLFFYYKLLLEFLLDGWSYLNTVERFDFITKTWSFVGKLRIN